MRGHNILSSASGVEYEAVMVFPEITVITITVITLVVHFVSEVIITLKT